MKRIDGYIFRTVTLTALVALLVMLCLDVFFNILREIEHLGEGSYGLLTIAQFLLLTLPRRIYEVLPMALLVGGLLGMGALATSSELVVMRAAGVSVLRLVYAALKAGLVLSLIGLLLGEFVAPYTERLAQTLRADARDKPVTIGDGDGFWARDGAYFINVRGVEPGMRLADIYVYEVDERSDLRSIARAEGAHYVQGRWVLEGVSRSRIDPEQVQADSMMAVSWESVITPEMLDVLATKPEDLSLRDLGAFITYLQDNRLNAETYELTFWNKAIGPLTNLAMLFIGMPFVFGSQRRTGAGQRLLIGVLLGLAFYLANRMLGNTVLLYGLPPWLGASLPTLVFFVAGGYALHRVR